MARFAEALGDGADATAAGNARNLAYTILPAQDERLHERGSDDDFCHFVTDCGHPIYPVGGPSSICTPARGAKTPVSPAV